MGTFDDELASAISPQQRGAAELEFAAVLSDIHDARQDQIAIRHREARDRDSAEALRNREVKLRDAAEKYGRNLGWDPAKVDELMNSRDPTMAAKAFVGLERKVAESRRKSELHRERGAREERARDLLREEEFTSAASRLLRIPEDEVGQEMRNMSGGERADFGESVENYIRRQRIENAARNKGNQPRFRQVVPGSSEGEFAGDPDTDPGRYIDDFNSRVDRGNARFSERVGDRIRKPFRDTARFTETLKAVYDMEPDERRGFVDALLANAAEDAPQQTRTYRRIDPDWLAANSPWSDGSGPDTGDPLIDGMSVADDDYPVPADAVWTSSDVVWDAPSGDSSLKRLGPPEAPGAEIDRIIERLTAQHRQTADQSPAPGTSRMPREEEM